MCSFLLYTKVIEWHTCTPFSVFCPVMVHLRVLHIVPCTASLLACLLLYLWNHLFRPSGHFLLLGALLSFEWTDLILCTPLPGFLCLFRQDIDGVCGSSRLAAYWWKKSQHTGSQAPVTSSFLCLMPDPEYALPRHLWPFSLFFFFFFPKTLAVFLVLTNSSRWFPSQAWFYGNGVSKLPHDLIW